MREKVLRSRTIDAMRSMPVRLSSTISLVSRSNVSMSPAPRICSTKRCFSGGRIFTSSTSRLSFDIARRKVATFSRMTRRFVRMNVAGLFTSCATPPAICPMAASFPECMSFAWASFND
jgi:hypothetical protein